MQQSAAQRIADVQANQLSRYVAGENEIPARVATALDWLLLGKGLHEGKAPVGSALLRLALSMASERRLI